MEVRLHAGLPGNRNWDRWARGSVLPAFCQPGDPTQRWEDGDRFDPVTSGTRPRTENNNAAVSGGLSRSQAGVLLIHPSQGQRSQVLLSSGQGGDRKER